MKSIGKGGRSRGFTIVELLIVIVVIGILATLVLIGYGNIQTKAENVKTISAVKGEYDALAVYKAKNGDFPRTPTTSGTDYACISTIPGSACMSLDSTVVYGAGIAYQDNTLNTSLLTVASVIPTASTQKVVFNGHPMSGAYVDLQVNSDRHISLYYVLAGGNTQCSDVGIVATKTEIARSSSGVFCSVDSVQ